MTVTDDRRFWLSAVATVVVGLMVASMVAFATTPGASPSENPGAGSVSAQPAVIAPLLVPASASTGESAVGRAPGRAKLPFGEGPIFADRRVVAYYGTAGTGALGVLGERRPDVITKKLRKAAAPFASKGIDVQIAYELIVTIADASPGQDGDYSHDIDRAAVRRYIEAAHRNKALLILDLQPGRSNFLKVAKRWAWALKDPYVGLALDPEWRMGPHQVPGRVIGSVSAREVNQVSKWLVNLQHKHNLPEKIFMLHTFRTSMLPGVARIKKRSGLAMVQHVDGFGTPSQKLATYHAVAHPKTFRMGFKLFYDEDIQRMSAARVKKIRPHVKFVSFQ